MDKTSKNITLFVLIWLVVNLFTAGYLELSADESYYWLYGYELDWGYFDHPPLIAIFNSIIDRNLWHSELSVRLLSVLSTGGFFYFLYKIIEPRNDLVFILLCSSTVAIHVFGFTSLPDTPLLFLSAGFFYFFQKYVNQENRINIFALCLIVPLLFYTKYHAVLIILFSLIAFPILLKRKSFYLILIVSLILYAPHIFWQIKHDYPSIKYHFIERNATEFRWIFVWDYFSNQFFFYGTLLIPLAIVSIFKYSNKLDAKDRILKINLFGFFLFFLWSSYKDFVEVNWTLPALTSILYFSYQYYENSKYGKRIIYWVTGTSLLVICILRVHLLFPFIETPFLDRTQDFRGHKEFVDRINSKIKNTPLVVTRYQEAGLFSYYTDTLVPSINLNGRKNQFNSWNLFPQINGESYFLLSDHVDTTEIITSQNRKYTLGYHKNLPAFSGVQIENSELEKKKLRVFLTEKCFKNLTEKSPENPTKLVIKIASRDFNQSFDLPITELKNLDDRMISLDFQKSLEKDSYKIEILLYSANFGTWSESWRKEIEVK